MHIFGQWEEARVPRGNPDRHGENMQTHTQKGASLKSNQGLLALIHQCKLLHEEVGARALYKQNMNKLMREIYSKKLKNTFSANDPASAWKGQRDITSYRTQKYQDVSLHLVVFCTLTLLWVFSLWKVLP